MDPGMDHPAAADLSFEHNAPIRRDLHWVLLGETGVRAGWSLVLFALLYRAFSMLLGTIALGMDPALARPEFTAPIALVGELIPLLAMVGAVACVARIEHRAVWDYNLARPLGAIRFLSGAGVGFAALSALVGALALGSWLRFAAATLSPVDICVYALLWALVFLLVALFEEGTFRCYLQATLTRGLNFWWAAAIVATLVLDVFLRSHGRAGVVAFLWMSRLSPLHGAGVWGIYIFALAGVIPCYALDQKIKARSAFWQAAWVTSTFFGFAHTTNGGENWIGIFAAATIGFVFCASVRLTGSAWWAIGCHAAWDWAETFFYGTADSGFRASGHFLSSAPAGNALWSGGADGPEGSLLVVPIISLLLAALIALYGRRPRTRAAA